MLTNKNAVIYGAQLTDERWGCTGCSDLAPWDRNEDGIESPNAWWRRHDEYNKQ